MVNSVSASVPFSYLDKLQNTPGNALPKKNIAPTTDKTPKTVPAKTEQTNSLAKRLNLPVEILNILQSAEEGTKPSKSAGIAAILGDTTSQKSSTDIVSEIYSNLLNSNNVSAALQIASQAVSSRKTAANLSSSPLDKVLADYSKTLNFGNEFLKPKTQTSA